MEELEMQLEEKEQALVAASSAPAAPQVWFPAQFHIFQCTGIKMVCRGLSQANAELFCMLACLLHHSLAGKFS